MNINNYRFIIFLFLISFATSAAERPLQNQIKEKAIMSNESYPNYIDSPQSPEIDDDKGVVITLSTRTFSTGSPIIVRGAFKVGQLFIDESDGVPMGRIILIVNRRDKVAVWHGHVRDISNMALTPADPDAAVDPHYRETGYFNVDLSKLCNIVKTPGKYWVMASMGDWVSERIPFEVTL